jgi:hypothetical protein
MGSDFVRMEPRPTSTLWTLWFDFVRVFLIKFRKMLDFRDSRNSLVTKTKNKKSQWSGVKKLDLPFVDRSYLRIANGSVPNVFHTLRFIAQ